MAGDTYKTFKWFPQKHTRKRVEYAQAALEDFSPRTVRSIYYYMVSRNLIANSKSSYRSISEMLVNARKAGMIPWSAIVDNVRGIQEIPYWSSLDDFKEWAPDVFHLDPTPGQEEYCEVWLEKDALATIIEPVCREYRVPIHVCRGWDSWTMTYEAVKRFNKRGRKAQYWHVFHLADFDPAGWFMTEDIKGRFEFFGEVVNVTRLALTPEQAETLPKNFNQPGRKDKTGQKFLDLFGPVAVELDALEIEDLRAIVQDAFRQVIDRDALSAVLVRETEDRARLAAMLEDNGG